MKNTPIAGIRIPDSRLAQAAKRMRTRPMPTIGADVTWQRDAETGEWKATPVEKVHHAKGAEELLPRLPLEEL